MQEPEPIDEQPNEAVLDPKIEKLRAELARLTAKRNQSKDKDILSVFDMRIMQIQQELPAKFWPKSGEKIEAKANEDPEEELGDVPEPTPEERDKAEKLIRQARLEKQRGNTTASTKLLRDAVDVAPGSAVVMEALADDLIERKQIKEARKILRRAHLLDPKNVALERKFAEIVLKGSANMNIEEQLRMGSDSLFLTDNDKVAGIWAARFLSFFIPGVGQMVVGRTVKGISMFVGYAICFSLIIIWQNDVKSLLLMFSKSHTGSINPLVFIPLAGGALIWIMAMGDLSGGQSRSVVRKRIEHPKPPADLPFE